MKKPVATIPEDLRSRDDLTLKQVNRVMELRKRRDVLLEDVADLRAKIQTLTLDLDSIDREEGEILHPITLTTEPANSGA